jgi:hypothetical protein
MIRRLKQDVFDQLPEKRRSEVFLKVSDAQQRKINRVKKQLELGGGGGDGGQAGNPVFTELYKTTGLAKLDAVQEYIEMLMDGNIKVCIPCLAPLLCIPCLTHLMDGNIKFIVFAHHLEVMDSLQECVEKAKTSYIRIDGKTPHKVREVSVDKFQHDPTVKVAILSIKACSQGLTLTAASNVVFAEICWNPSDLMQVTLQSDSSTSSSFRCLRLTHSPPILSHLLLLHMHTTMYPLSNPTTMYPLSNPITMYPLSRLRTEYIASASLAGATSTTYWQRTAAMTLCGAPSRRSWP